LLKLFARSLYAAEMVAIGVLPPAVSPIVARPAAQRVVEELASPSQKGFPMLEGAAKACCAHAHRSPEAVPPLRRFRRCTSPSQFHKPMGGNIEHDRKTPKSLQCCPAAFKKFSKTRQWPIKTGLDDRLCHRRLPQRHMLE
jgi:hypothetical protein